MTKVYLMVEVDVEGSANNSQAREMARAQVIRAMESASGNRTGGACSFTWSRCRFFVHDPAFLPDDMPEVLKMAAMRGLTRDQMLKRAVIEDGKKPPKERFQALVDRGAINEKGEVLLKSPLMEDED
jgi:hypothetical protein